MQDTEGLVPLELLGTLLAEQTGDEGWRSSRATLIAGGKSNLTFELHSAAGTVIYRRPPSAGLLPSAHDMGREARVIRRLAGTAVPVPTVLLTDDGELTGVPGYVMSKVEGHVIRDGLPAGYADTVEEKTAIANVLVDTLVDLHAVAPAEVGLADFGRPQGFLARQIRRWRAQSEQATDQVLPEMEELARQLAVKAPAHPGETIVHGDFRLDNCLMGIDDPARVAAVLDWELSTLGDPLTDLAMLLFYWGRPGSEGPRLTPRVTRQAGFPGSDYLARRYEAQTGAGLDDLAFYEAFAHFKFAAVTQGIASRVAAGAMAGQDFGDLGDEVQRLAETGLLRIEKG
ncbi:MAG: Phosphotransferase enzyme family protein [Marmoricola sp.]|nr:Phosphotransferase enzyme family protein [Marmoricola sp.]